MGLRSHGVTRVHTRLIPIRSAFSTGLHSGDFQARLKAIVYRVVPGDLLHFTLENFMGRLIPDEKIHAASISHQAQERDESSDRFKACSQGQERTSSTHAVKAKRGPVQRIQSGPKKVGKPLDSHNSRISGRKSKLSLVVIIRQEF